MRAEVRTGASGASTPKNVGFLRPKGPRFGSLGRRTLKAAGAPRTASPHQPVKG